MADSTSNEVLDLLATRRSVVVKMLGEPGPSPAQIDVLLRAASRVPDHKMLEPWRFLVFEGDVRAQIGAIFAGIGCLRNEHDLDAGALDEDAERFLRAPLVIGVISAMRDTKPVPQWEQILSAGAACQTLLTAATAMGFGAQWITEWIAYEPRVRPVLGLGTGERVAGFVYVGTALKAPSERRRPDLDVAVRRWALAATRDRVR